MSDVKSLLEQRTHAGQRWSWLVSYLTYESNDQRRISSCCLSFSCKIFQTNNPVNVIQKLLTNVRILIHAPYERRVRLYTELLAIIAHDYGQAFNSWYPHKYCWSLRTVSPQTNLDLHCRYYCEGRLSLEKQDFEGDCCSPNAFCCRPSTSLKIKERNWVLRI